MGNTRKPTNGSNKKRFSAAQVEELTARYEERIEQQKKIIEMQKNRLLEQNSSLIGSRFALIGLVKLFDALDETPDREQGYVFLPARGLVNPEDSLAAENQEDGVHLRLKQRDLNADPS